MVCIEKRPYTLYGRLATLHFRYLTCLLDRGHIRLIPGLLFTTIFNLFHAAHNSCKLIIHQPLTPPNVTPRTMNLERHRYTTITGRIAHPSIM